MVELVVHDTGSICEIYEPMRRLREETLGPLFDFADQKTEASRMDEKTEPDG